MPTRFYFSAGTAPAITPAYDPEWNKTANAVRRLLSQSKLTTIAVTSSEFATNAATFDILNRQLISKPLGAGKPFRHGQRANAVVRNRPLCRLFPGPGYQGGIRRRPYGPGHVLADFPASLTSEYAATLTNRNFPPSTALTPVDTQDGDYLVMEIGARAFNASTSSMGFSCRLQDGATVADLPEDEQHHR